MHVAAPFGVLHYIINVRVSKYFVTFETTILYLWELRFSRECPVREASPSDASGVVSRLATTIIKFLALESNCETQAAFVVHYHNSDTRAEKATKGLYELQNEEELPIAMPSFTQFSIT